MTKFASNVLLFGCFLSVSTMGATAEPNPGIQASAGVSTAAVSAPQNGCSLTDALRAAPSLIDTCLPEPASAAHRQAVLDTLPPKGDVNEFNDADQAKLAAIAAVLGLHGRENIYTIKVIDIPQAWTGLHGRAVVLISKPALRMLKAAELQALVAHEIGHEFLWAQYEHAHQTGDHRRVHKLELAADGVGVRTLQALEIAPENLVKALVKVENYNREMGGIDDGSHPSLKERKHYIKGVASTS